MVFTRWSKDKEPFATCSPIHDGEEGDDGEEEKEEDIIVIVNLVL